MPESNNPTLEGREAPTVEGMEDALKSALADLTSAVEFRDKVHAASLAGEDTSGAGAFRDALQWIDSASRAVVAAYAPPTGAAEGAKEGGTDQ